MNDTNDKVKIFMDELFYKYYTDVHELVSKEFTCSSIAEDITQETFYDALCNAAELLTHENPGEWLKETAQSKIMKAKINLMKYNERETSNLISNLSGLESANGLSELSFLTQQPITVHEKALFYMYHYGGYTAEELAKSENTPARNFLSGMRRLCKKLQKRTRETKFGRKGKKK